MWNVTSVLPALRNLLAFVTSLWFAGQHDEELQRQFAARQNLMADIQELTRNYSSELVQIFICCRVTMHSDLRSRGTVRVGCFLGVA